MAESADLKQLLERLPGYREALAPLREKILANAIMCGEIPSPTFEEERLAQFLRDRFTESGLLDVSRDEMGNAAALLPGSEGKRTILVAAHVDKVWDKSVDHSVSVTEQSLKGPGIADNSVGVAAVASLPEVLAHLGVRLRADLVLLGATRSMGRGNLAGLRFFLDHAKVPLHTAVCVEGVQLGRLSYSSLGMVRGEIHVRTPEEQDWLSYNSSGAIVALNRILDRILAIETPSKPETSIILGSVRAGTAYNVPPTEAVLRFEVRSAQPGMVTRIRKRIQEIVDQINAEDRVTAELSIIARRKPGGIDFSHPLVRATRQVMGALGIESKVAPSTSELSTLVDKRIPSVTLGITRGEFKHSPDERVSIGPFFDGMAQLVGVLCAIDGGICDG